jgi:predicted PurR-regulated permease PerM
MAVSIGYLLVERVDTADHEIVRVRMQSTWNPAGLRCRRETRRMTARFPCRAVGAEGWRSGQAMSPEIQERSPSLQPWAVRGAGFAVGVAIVVGLLALGIAARSVLLLLFLAIVFAAALEPIVGWSRGHLNLGRGATILLVYGAFLLAVAGLALLVVPAAIGQLQTAVERVPPLLDRAEQSARDLPSPLAGSVSALTDAARRIVAPQVDTTPAAGQVVQVGMTVAEAVASVATLLTLVYFWLTEHARIQRYVLAFVPVEKRSGARDTWNQVETRLGLWVRGQLILMAAIGTSTTIAYTVLGLPGSLLLGVAAAIAEAIPIIGPFLGAIPALIVAATVSWQLTLVVAGVYVVLQFLEGNVLVPIVMRNTIGISPFLVLISLLIGAAAAGVVGALLAVPIAAAVEVVVEGLQAREVPVAQDPRTTSVETDESTDDAPDKPERSSAASSEMSEAVTTGRR